MKRSASEPGLTLVLNKLVVTCQYCKRMSLNSNLITIGFGSLLSSEVVFKEIHLIWST